MSQNRKMIERPILSLIRKIEEIQPYASIGLYLKKFEKTKEKKMGMHFTYQESRAIIYTLNF